MFEVNVKEIIKKSINTAEKLLITKPEDSENILQQYLRIYNTSEREYDEYDKKAYKLLGILNIQKRNFPKAIEYLEKCNELFPNDTETLNDLSLAYAGTQQYSKAESIMQEAIKLKPDCYYFYTNLALQYREQQKYDLAHTYIDKAIEMNPKDPTLYVNKGGMYGELKQIDEALKYINKALELNPEMPQAHVDKAYALHLKGEWEKAFEEYEWRFKLFNQLKFYKAAYDEEKKWNGKDNLSGKRIILYCEQGLGDVINFARYIKFVSKKGAYVLVHCPPALDSIIKRIEGVNETFAKEVLTNDKDGIPEHDYHCSIMSLPFLLKEYKIEGNTYIQPSVTYKFKEQENYKNTFNIGVSWAGSALHPNDRARSFHLNKFKSIHDIHGVKLFSLQQDLRTRVYYNSKGEEVNFSDGCEDMKIVDLSPMIQTFEDTTAFVTGLDLVISCDTALVHLCGALGVPCWVLLPFNCDWRWKAEGTSTEWYNSLRLFRQPKINDWDSVFTDVQKALEKNFENHISNKR